MIELNQTLFFQVIGYFILLITLNRFLYRPLLKVLEERDERTSGALKNASQADKDVEEGLRAYEKRLKEAALKGHEERNRLRQEAIEKEKELLDAARTLAAGEFAAMRAELEKSKGAALSSLKDETKSISRNIAEKILERKVVVMLFAFMLPLLPVLSHAAEEGEHGGGMALFWKAVNFAILAVAVYIIWKKVISGLLTRRSEDIKKALDEALAAKETADKRSAEYKEKLAMLEASVAQIHNELRLEGEAEKQRMITEAEASSVKIREQARIAAGQEVKKARIEIRREVASLAVKMAEEILKKELSPADQERLAKGYIDNLRLN